MLKEFERGDSSEELAANVFGFDAYQEDQRDRLLKASSGHQLPRCCHACCCCQCLLSPESHMKALRRHGFESRFQGVVGINFWKAALVVLRRIR